MLETAYEVVETEPCTLAERVVQPLQMLTFVGLTETLGQADCANKILPREKLKTKNKQHRNTILMK